MKINITMTKDASAEEVSAAIGAFLEQQENEAEAPSTDTP